MKSSRFITLDISVIGFQFFTEVKKIIDQACENHPHSNFLGRAYLKLSKFKQLLRNPPFGVGVQGLFYLRLFVKYIFNIYALTTRSVQEHA
jgi:hypothetical protein